MNRPTSLLLNAAHALDHLVLLVFASAVATIAIEFGIDRWEDLMPYTAGAFIMFGIGSVPSGRLGDLWGRRKMMLVFFAGTTVSCIAVALAQNPIQIAIALTIMGAFASIYHPVGIPMLLSATKTPGMTIGVNNLAGNMGLAIAAILTGFMVKYFGWRAAFILPAVLSACMGLLFARVAPEELHAPGKKKSNTQPMPRQITMRALTVTTIASTSGALLFNFTTNGNTELFRERFAGVISDPATLGMLLACVYAVAAFSQVIVGRLIDRISMKPLYLGVVLSQILLFVIAAQSSGWMLFFCALGFMAAVFGAIPFLDAVVVRYVDDRMRSRVAGIRIAISFGVSGVAVYLLGPIVKASSFETLFFVMAVIACCTAFTVTWLPSERRIKDALLAQQ
ncbi:MAG: MFS transporter [Burkholderiaceae bacterium]|nr:MFS transporter [Burkholderiaceae bacterium]